MIYREKSIFVGMELTAKIIQKYNSKSVSELIKICQRHFNQYIRNRDKGQPCINCGKLRELQAGHFYPTSTHSHLRFHEDNTNGECLQCNYFNSQSHSYGYAVNLRKKIGEERMQTLEQLASRKIGFKWDRFTLIEKIEHYKNLNKNFAD